MLSASGKWHVRPGGRWAARHLGALPWTVRTLPEARQSALVSAGPGRACWGGRDLFWRLHCSLSFPEESRGCPVASLHFRPQYTFQRQAVLSGRRDPQPCLACCPPQGISGHAKAPGFLPSLSCPPHLQSGGACLPHPGSSQLVFSLTFLGLGNPKNSDHQPQPVRLCLTCKAFCDLGLPSLPGCPPRGPDLLSLQCPPCSRGVLPMSTAGLLQSWPSDF